MNQMVIDLHIEKIAKGYKAFNASDSIEYQKKYFKEIINRYKKQKGVTIDFIHGSGKGVLRNELISILDRDYPGITYSDAPFAVYGYQGALRITIR